MEEDKEDSKEVERRIGIVIIRIMDMMESKEKEQRKLAKRQHNIKNEEEVGEPEKLKNNKNRDAIIQKTQRGGYQRHRKGGGGDKRNDKENDLEEEENNNDDDEKLGFLFGEA